MMLRRLGIACVFVAFVSGASAEMPTLEKEVSIKAPLDAVWRAWTTSEGLAFLSPESNIELRINGAYEWFLDGEPDDRGKRGGEGAYVLAFLPQKMIAFSWTFPPAVPELRYADERTQVVVMFDENSDGTVHVSLHAHGWQDGEPWQQGWAYFDSAWGFVLDEMKKHLESAE